MSLRRNELEALLYDVAASPGADCEQCAQAWTEAMVVYIVDVQPALFPPPAALIVAPAALTLHNALTVAFATLPSAAPGMETAFAEFATTLAGAVGKPGYTGSPPPQPVGFAELFAEPPPLTHAAAAERMANLIHAWAVTGLATPPVGAAVNWS